MSFIISWWISSAKIDVKIELNKKGDFYETIKNMKQCE